MTHPVTCFTSAWESLRSYGLHGSVTDLKTNLNHALSTSDSGNGVFSKRKGWRNSKPNSCSILQFPYHWSYKQSLYTLLHKTRHLAHFHCGPHTLFPRLKNTSYWGMHTSPQWRLTWLRRQWMISVIRHDAEGASCEKSTMGSKKLSPPFKPWHLSASHASC